MRFPQAPPRRQLFIAALAAMLATLAACGSSGPAKPSATASSTSPPPSSAPATASAAAAKSAIKTNWEAFFSAKTPVSHRIALLQNGELFAAIIRAQAGSPLASAATAQVTKVTLASPTQASVTYSILVSGKTALPNQAGVAVNQDGTWKVGDGSFCGLLLLEYGGKATSLPAPCRTGG